MFIPRDSVLAIGVIFASFTQLRFGAAPLGFGELCLLAWLALTFTASMGVFSAPLTAHFRPLAAFWLVFAGSLCIGTMTAFVVGERNAKELFVHDALAYTLMAALSLLAVVQADAPARMRGAAWIVVLFGSACLAAQLAEGFGVATLSGLEVWYYNRFQGWTTNANQLGLLCLVLALLSLHLAEIAERRATRLAALAGAVLPVWTGILTRSDAFAIALGLGVFGLLVLHFWKMMHGPRKPRALAAAATMLAVVALPALVISSIPLAYVMTAERLAERAEMAQSEGGLARDVGFRTELLNEAVDRILDSSMLGLGPGPHLIRPPDLREPQMDLLPNFEAHNTVIDLMLQGGLVAVMALVWFGATTVNATLKAKLNVLPILLLSVGGFALSHFVIRHPIIWFVIALACVARAAPRPLEELPGQRGMSEPCLRPA